MKNTLSKVYLAGVLSLVINAGFAAPSLASVHAAGTNVVSNGTIYMITDDGQRRPYTSAGAFLSYGFNNWPGVQPATAEDMALTQGSFIPPRDGKIVCSDRGSDKGTCYLITDGKRAAFVSAKVFTDLGFSFAKTLTGDVSFLPKDADITDSRQQHRSGVLVNKNGTVYLVSDSGLLGVPSTDVLGTWGYSFADVVPANSADGSQTQTGVISNRQGAQLTPSVAPAKVDESSLVQGYIDTYPDLPATTISAAQDGAQVIDLIKKLEALPGNSFEAVYPYLTSQSIEILNQAPNFKKYYESSYVHLVGMSSWTSKVDVFTGGTQALYTETNIQTQTSYKQNFYWVCKKENGVWKWDFIGTLKYQKEVAQQDNSTGVYTIGSGTDDISLVDAFYSENPLVNDPNTGLIAEVKNSGQTTIKQFDLLVYFNNTVVVDETDSYDLPPGQAVYLAIPIDYYWTLDSVRKSPGQYATDIRVSLGRASNEVNVADDKFSLTTNFQQGSASSSISNLVGQ